MKKTILTPVIAILISASKAINRHSDIFADALLSTAVTDGAIAYMHDSQIQDVYIEANYQEQYNRTQAWMTTAMGGLIAPAAQLVGRRFKGVSGLQDGIDKLDLLARTGPLKDSLPMLNKKPSYSNLQSTTQDLDPTIASIEENAIKPQQAFKFDKQAQVKTNNVSTKSYKLPSIELLVKNTSKIKTSGSRTHLFTKFGKFFPPPYLSYSLNGLSKGGVQLKSQPV